MTVGDGLVRLRANQIGKQTVFGTAVAATRRVPWRGLVTYNPNRTNPDIDPGSLDPIVSPVSGVPTVEWNPGGPLTYDDLPYRLAAALKGGVTPTGGGTAKTWVYQVASLTADAFDYFTVESGDDQSATDGIQAHGGVIDSFSEEMSDDLGPITFSDTWVFAGANLATNRTGALTIDEDPVFVNGDETDITIDSAAGSIGITPISDAFHAYSLNIGNNLDRKKFANGSNSRRKLAGYGRGERGIELVLTFAKTAETMAEFNTLDDEPVPTKYIQIRTVSTSLAQSGTPYSYTRRGAFKLFEAVPGEIGGNATIVATYRAVYDSTLTYAFRATVVDQLAAL